MALRTYLATEIALDHADGLLSRRDALHKLGLLGLTTAAASTLLASCSSDGTPGSGAERRPGAARLPRPRRPRPTRPTTTSPRHAPAPRT